MDNVQLVDFLKMPLKSKNDYSNALDILSNSPVKRYMEKYHLLLLGDHPTQFYSRKVVYEAIERRGTQSSSESPQQQLQQETQQHSESSDSPMPDFTPSISRQQAQESQPAQRPPPNEQQNRPSNQSSSTVSNGSLLLIQTVLVFLGALHVQLNAREEVVMIYWHFF